MINVYPKKQENTLSSIQAFRGIAAILVMLFHYYHFLGPEIKDFGYSLFFNGRIGVPVFFVISGFIMAYTTNSHGFGKAYSFAMSRIIRIVPLYFFCTLIYLLILNISLSDLSQVNNIELIKRSLLFYPLTNINGPTYGFSIMPVGWTLNYDMLFYAIFSLSLLFGRLYLGVMLLIFSTILIIVPTLFAGMFSMSPEVDYGFDLAYNSLATNPIMWNFVAGIACGVLIKNNRLHIQRRISILILTLFSIAYLIQYATGFNSGWGFTEWGIGAVILIYLYANHEINHGMRVNAILIKLGELSFSIYLLHLPAKEFIYMIGEKLDIPTMKTGTIYVLLSIAVTILASFLTRRYIEIKLSSRIKKLIIPKVQTKSPLSLQQS
ncbi:acyltransferase family protein [Citrobacter freundii]|uniref:acyltransferase family protein n=1 Tax=Citrobacter freundii TaxID=546 RepID=UPI001F1542B9|nr:acyltransferase [Citrobacter freundii]